MTPKPPRTILEALGGPVGIIDSVAPSTAFVMTYVVSGHRLAVAAGVAGLVGLILGAVRVAKGQTVLHAAGGLAGVALAAFVALRSGRAENYFLPGLLLNGLYATGSALSIMIRWPFLGVAANLMTRRGMGWRRDLDERKAYSQASWLWVVLFASRVAVQLPLYLAGAVLALGVANLAMNQPLTAAGLWMTYLLLRRRVAILRS